MGREPDELCLVLVVENSVERAEIRVAGIDLERFHVIERLYRVAEHSRIGYVYVLADFNLESVCVYFRGVPFLYVIDRQSAASCYGYSTFGSVEGEGYLLRLFLFAVIINNICRFNGAVVVAVYSYELPEFLCAAVIYRIQR